MGKEIWCSDRTHQVYEHLQVVWTELPVERIADCIAVAAAFVGSSWLQCDKDNVNLSVNRTWCDSDLMPIINEWRLAARG